MLRRFCTSTVLLKLFWACSHDANRVHASLSLVGGVKCPGCYTGSIGERIKDCSTQDDAQNGNFVLVSRTHDLKEVHLDTKSRLLWGDRLKTGMSHKYALGACKRPNYLSE